mmetsp:Transcript_910/g.1284  ORF Transcript_910/g.1284 Transcript_910/m.1284 type:complete len:280 (+) Transcript_910:219-1058(+)
MEIIKNSLNSFLKPRAQFEAELEPTSYLPKIPPKGTLFKEGYLMKRSRNGGNNWRRRFFVLSYKKNSEPGSSGTFSYTDTFSGEAKSKAKFAISGKATVRFSDMFKDAGYNSSQCLEILPNTEDEGQPPLYIASSDRNDITSWKAAIEACIAKSRGDTYQFEDVCSRFYEGTLFKTNREADTWMARHMELHGTELWWYHEPGGELRGKVTLVGAQIETRKTEATAAPTGYLFQVRAAERTLNLAAQNESEYLYWLKAIHQNLSSDDYVKRLSRGSKFTL